MRVAPPSSAALLLAALIPGCREEVPSPEMADTASPAPDAAMAQVAEAPPAARPRTALVGATVFDGTGSDPIADAVVLLEKDRIAKVGPKAEIEIPADAFVVDVGGKWIVPGLVDSHIHFFQSGGAYTRPDILDLRAVRAYEDERQAIKDDLPDLLRRTLRSGITAVVDMGGPLWNFEAREQAQKTVYAPRVAVAGPLISTVSRPQLEAGDPPIIRAESPDAARELVREQLEKKPDLIKVWFIVMPDQKMDATVKMLRAVVDESHRAGVRVAVHATEVESARAAVTAGAEILVHSIHDAVVDDALVAQMKERGTILVPTLAVMEGYAEVLGNSADLTEFERRFGDPAVIASFDEVPAAPPQAEERITRLRERTPIMVENLKKLFAAGVHIAAGTDAGNIGTLHGVSFHHELDHMVKAGLTPRDVLLSATRDAARVFAKEPESGTLEEGKLADLLVLDADPLADISALQRIHRIVKGGAVMEPDRIHVPNPAWVVQQQVNAYNARDIERFIATFAEDAVVRRFPEGEERMRGHAGLRETYERLFAESPKLHCRVVNRTVQGRFVVDRELVTGLRQGPVVRAVAVYEVEDGLIQNLWFLPRE